MKGIKLSSAELLIYSLSSGRSEWARSLVGSAGPGTVIQHYGSCWYKSPVMSCSAGCTAFLTITATRNKTRPGVDPGNGVRWRKSKREGGKEKWSNEKEDRERKGKKREGTIAYSGILIRLPLNNLFYTTVIDNFEINKFLGWGREKKRRSSMGSSPSLFFRSTAFWKLPYVRIRKIRNFNKIYDRALKILKHTRNTWSE